MVKIIWLGLLTGSLALCAATGLLPSAEARVLFSWGGVDVDIVEALKGRKKSGAFHNADLI